MSEYFSKLLGFPLVASAHGAQIDNIVLIIHLIMLILFVGWFAFFVYTLIRFRASKNPNADYLGAKCGRSRYGEGLESSSTTCPDCHR